MRTYSPYDNVEKKAYPWLLVTTSINDSQVMYWEPAKWVAKLRAMKTDSNPLYLKTNLAGGHGGSSGRYDRLREIAFRYAFMLDAVGLAREGAGRRRGKAGQPLHLEVLFAFKGLDFRIAGEEYRVELDGCRDRERIGIRDRVLGLQLGRATHSPARRVLDGDGKSPTQGHAPERLRLVASLDADQAVVRFAEIDDGGHALGAGGFGFIKPVLNRCGTRLVLKPCEPRERIEAGPTVSLHGGAPRGAPSTRWCPSQNRAACAIRADAAMAVSS